MILNKYSETKNGSTIGAFSPSPGSSSSGSSSSSGRSENVDRDLWGQHDTGDDIDGSMVVNGNIYLGDIIYNEDDDDDDEIDAQDSNYDHEFPSETGNLFAASSLGSPEVYGHKLFLNVLGKKTDLLEYLSNLFLPVGSVIMYAGNKEIPDNWAICDGSNGTPDLRGKFIKCADSLDNVGVSGGNEAVTITASNLPKLSIPTYQSVSSNEGPFYNLPYDIRYGETGSPLDIQPPFFSLIFIMRIK